MLAVNFRPAAVGFDVVVHSATKYYNGHSDIVAGIVASSMGIVDKVLSSPLPPPLPNHPPVASNST